MKNYIKNRKKAFTLPEVLLVLTILGTLMALTVPVLLIDASNRSFTPLLQRSFSSMENTASKIMVNNSGTLERAFTSSIDARDKFGNNLEYILTCAAGSVTGNCWANSTFALSGGDSSTVESFAPNTGYVGAVLSDKSFLLVNITNTTCNGVGVSIDNKYASAILSEQSHLCGNIVVDTNGFEGPNTFGRDIFMFLLGSDGIHRGGDEFTLYNDLAVNCNIANTTHNGYGCADKVINEGEMSY